MLFLFFIPLPHAFFYRLVLPPPGAVSRCPLFLRRPAPHVQESWSFVFRRPGLSGPGIGCRKEARHRSASSSPRGGKLPSILQCCAPTGMPAKEAAKADIPARDKHGLQADPGPGGARAGGRTKGAASSLRRPRLRARPGGIWHSEGARGTSAPCGARVSQGSSSHTGKADPGWPMATQKWCQPRAADPPTKASRLQQPPAVCRLLVRRGGSCQQATCCMPAPARRHRAHASWGESNPQG